MAVGYLQICGALWEMLSIGREKADDDNEADLPQLRKNHRFFFRKFSQHTHLKGRGLKTGVLLVRLRCVSCPVHYPIPLDKRLRLQCVRRIGCLLCVVKCRVAMLQKCARAARSHSSPRKINKCIEQVQLNK